MVKTNLYRLNVVFEDGFTWDIRIQAVSVNAVCMWIKPDQKIRAVSINLIQEDYQDLEDKFLARTVTESWEDRKPRK